MKFTDTILSFMKMNDYDDDYDEDYDDYEDEDDKDYEAPKPVRKSVTKRYEESNEEEESKPVQKIRSTKTKLVPVKTKNNMEMYVIKPASIEDGDQISDTLVSGVPVVLNLEGLHFEIAQRIIDFTCGACTAIDGDLQKVSSYIYIATPKNVGISGDIKQIINGETSSNE